MIGIGIGLGFFGGGSIDAQAQAHYNRVIADGGVVPAGLNGVNAFFTAVKTIYGTSDITTAVSVGLDAHYLGYKLGAGSGTTLEQAAQKLYSCAGSSGDVAQTTAASQPLLLNHSGQNYWRSNGSLNGVVSAPNISIPTSSGMSIEANVSFTTNDDLVNTSNWICSNDDGAGSRNMFLGFGSTRTLILYWANLSRVATATAQLPAAFNGWVKATLETSEGNMLAKFFTSLDGITYTQLGATITNSGGANTFQINPAAFWVAGNGGSNSILGKIFRAIYKDANGVTRSDFNPATYNASTSQTQWTSTTGEVWTINTGTATTGYKGALVDRTIVQGDGVDDLMAVTMSSKQYFSLYLAINGLSSSGNVALFNGGTTNTHLIFQTSSSNINAYNGVTLPFVGEVANRLFCATVNFNSTNSDTLYNDANKQTGNTGTNTSSGINIFGGAGNSFSNSIYNTLLSSLAVDTTVINTAIYNYIRSINNNAF
jgi:hypothetical protein